MGAAAAAQWVKSLSVIERERESVSHWTLAQVVDMLATL